MIMSASLPARKCREVWKEMRESSLGSVFRADMAGVGSPISGEVWEPWSFQVLGCRAMVCALAWQHQAGDSKGREVTSPSLQLRVEQR